MIKINVILHGGFGNQLFQYLKAKLEQKKYPNSIIYLHISCLGGYRVARNFELDKIISSEDIKVFEKEWFCKFRFLKLINRLFKQEIVFKFPSGTIIIDGYYQSLHDYKKYKENEIFDVITAIRQNFKKNIRSVEKEKIIHLRLTDFFSDLEKSYNYAISYLNKIQGKAEVLTDDDKLVGKAIKHLKRQELLTLVKSSELSALELIDLLSSYRTIHSNGSTLAFWGSMINQSVLYTTNDNLNHLYVYFSKITEKVNNA